MPAYVDGNTTIFNVATSDNATNCKAFVTIVCLETVPYQIVATGGVACAHCPALINTEQCSRIFCVRKLQRVLPSVANF